ncbi:MAG: hypothetical protein SFY66_00990 [Oculatellaceae cyanobacterium bins.114]|nr:hypothetical protein [Oculatellaceae cyanobacterium bins.114]
MTLLNSKKLSSHSDAIEQKFDFILQTAKQKSSSRLRTSLKQTPAQSPSKLSSPSKQTYPRVATKRAAASQPTPPAFKPSVQIQIGATSAAPKTNYRTLGLSLLASIVVVGGVGFKYSFDGAEASSNPLPAPSDLTSATTVSFNRVTPVATESVDGFAEGQAIAQQALDWSKSAASVDDWRIVTHKLEKAIKLLQAVPVSHANYDKAQTLIGELQNQLAIAQRNMNQTVPRDLGLSVANQASTETAVAGNCSSISTTPESLPVEIHNVDFQGANDDTGADFLIGCITNHSRQPITQLALIYKATSADAPDIFRTGREDIIPVEVRPGQTVAFRSSFTVNPAFQTVEIQGISWMPPEGEEAQITSTNVRLTR